MNKNNRHPNDGKKPITIFGPDFPFAFDDWIEHPAGLGSIPTHKLGAEVAIVGAGMAGMVAAYELMKLGLKPVVYEASKMGGRLRSQAFEGSEGVIAELGGMRFPVSSTAFYHYVDKLGLETKPFPNPLTPASGSTVIDLEGQTFYAQKLSDLPALFQEVADAWADALEAGSQFGDIQQAIRDRDVPRLKALWNTLSRCGTTARFMTLSRPPKPLPNSRSNTAKCSVRSASGRAAGTQTSPIQCSRSSAWS